jgi:hypothetical protein
MEGYTFNDGAKPYTRLSYMFGENGDCSCSSKKRRKERNDAIKEIQKRSALFRDITQRRVVILYLRFGTTYRSHLQGSRSQEVNCDTLHNIKHKPVIKHVDIALIRSCLVADFY